jgi:Tfp pilus assembly protein PilV
MNESPHPSARPRASEAGFSVVEGLIAAALLVFILIGVLPLFERSRLNLMQGNDSTQVANAVIDGTDRLYGMPFNSQITNVLPGTTQTQATDFWLLDENRWVLDMTPFPTDRAQFTRTTTVEQFQLTDLTDNGVLDTPLDGSAPGGTVHIKRITAQVVNARTALAGPATTFQVITYKVH